MRKRIACIAGIRSGLILAVVCCPTLHAGTGEYIFRSSFEDPASIQACPAAAPLELGFENAVNGAIDPAGDADFYAMDVVAGDWLIVEVASNEMNDPDLLDSVITLHTGDGTRQLARNDDAVRVGGRDSSLIHRVEQTGSLCIGIEDRSALDGTTPQGGPNFTYVMGASRLNFQDTGLNLDAGGNDSSAMPQTPLTYFILDGTFQHYALIAGDFDSANDVDVYEIATPTAAQRMQVAFHPSGADGNGGSTPLGIVEILDATGSSVVGRLDVANGSTGLNLPANEDSTYLLRVDSPPQALGSNPFYVFEFITSDAQNPQETNEPDNGSAATAEVANPLVGLGRTSHFIGGTLDAADVDWWSFQANPGDLISVFCASQRNGSGVLDLTVSLYDNPVSSPLQQDVETPFVDLAWSSVPGSTMPPVQATLAGTHYLRLLASVFSPEVTDRHYQCGIHVADQG